MKAKILAVPDEEPTAPKRTPTQIRDEVLVRPDLQRLKGIFGELTVTARFVPGARRWLVDVTEPGGLTVRSVQVSD